MIKFNYKVEEDKYVEGGSRTASCGNPFLAFAHEWLAQLFQADFDGYMGGDLQQWNRGARTRVKLLNTEMSKPPSHVRA